MRPAGMLLSLVLGTLSVPASVRGAFAQPHHLSGSGLPTRAELRLADQWQAAMRPPPGRGTAPKVEGWISGGLPFRFRYAGQDFSRQAPRWRCIQQALPAGPGVTASEWSWDDPATGLRVTWRVRRFHAFPALDWVLGFESGGRRNTALIEDVQSLSLDLTHAKPGPPFVVHGAHGGRCGRDDLMPFALPVRAAPRQAGPTLELIRQDYEQLEKRQSILRTPLTIGDRRFDRGLGTHSVSRIRIRSPQPIERFAAWVGVDRNERTAGGGGSVVFSLVTPRGEAFRSGTLRGGQPPVRVDVPVGGATVLDLNVDDAGDGPTCDHADWAEAALTVRGGQVVWLDDLPQAPVGGVHLGSRQFSSNDHLPFFNVETPGRRGVLVGLGWTGQWRADITQRGQGVRVEAGLRHTRFRLRPGERVRTPRVLVVPWQGERIHGHNMLRGVLYRHYLPRLASAPHYPMVSVNVCFTHHGNGAFLEQATEEKVLSLVEPFARLGAEALVIDAGWYECKQWTDIFSTRSFRTSAERYPSGFTRISERLRQAGMVFGLWFPPEALGDYADAKTRREFLRIVDGYVRSAGITMYRQDAGLLPTDRGSDREGVAEMQHIAGLYAMQDELRRRHPRMVMEGCCGGGRRIDLESLSRFHWHQKSDRWFDTVSDHCGLYGANLYLPGGVINVPTSALDDFGVWSSFGGQLCLAWHPLDADFPMQKALAHVALYKRLRIYLSGDFYPLTPCSLDAPWLAYQFHRRDLDAGFALVFRRNAGTSDTIRLVLRGLDPSRGYTVRNQSSGRQEEHAGAALVRGIQVRVPTSPGAELLTISQRGWQTAQTTGGPGPGSR